jgi:hypothetical protein
MALALIYPDPEKGGWGKKGTEIKGATTQSESVALSFPSRFLTHFAISMVSLSNAGRTWSRHLRACGRLSFRQDRRRERQR